MAKAGFDPYLKWLGIKPKDQPPNHYRLLGIDLFEDDPDIIEIAADKQMMVVRTFAGGPHSDDSQKILNELSAARVVLLNPEKKAEYDAELTRRVAPQRPTAVPLSKAQPISQPVPKAVPAARPAAAPARRPAAQAPSEDGQFDFQPSEASSVTSRLPSKKSPIQQPLVLGGVAVGLIAVVGLVLALGGGNDGGSVVEKDAGTTVVAEKGKTGDVVQPLQTEGTRRPVPADQEPEQPREDLPETETPAIDTPPVEADVVYLDDLEETDVRVNSASRLGKHGAWGLRAEKRIEIREMTPAHSLVTHPYAESFAYVQYAVPAGFPTLNATATIVPAARSQTVSDLTFSVLGDGRTLWRSRPLGPASQEWSQECEVAIDGVERVTLRVDCGGKAFGAWAAWINPRLVRAKENLPKGQPIDLLKLIDVDRDAVTGEWKFEGETLISPEDEYARIQIPYRPPAEYQIDAVVERKTGSDNFSVGLLGGGRRVLAVIDGWGGRRCALQVLDGNVLNANETDAPGPVLLNGEPSRVTFTVRSHSVSVTVDEKTIIEWEGDFRRFSSADHWAVPNEDHLFAMTYTSTYRIHSMTLTPLRDSGDTARSGKLHPNLGYELKPHPADAVEHGGHFYKAYPGQVTWEEAVKQCREMGGYPVCVESEEEAKFLPNVAKGLNGLIGAVRVRPGEWRWVNGAPMDFTYWHPTVVGFIKSENDRNRANLFPDGQWHPCNDSDRLIDGFLCEWEF